MSLYKDEIETIERILFSASELYSQHTNKSIVKENPAGVYDIVTPEDLDIEEKIVRAIAESFPEDGIISEEKGNDKLTDKRTWIIDPIDGTVNYSRNIPIYGTQLALMDKKRPVLAVIYLPSYDEIYVATEDGAFLNGKKISVSDSRPLRECISSLGDFSRRSKGSRNKQAKILDGIYDKIGRIKMMGASCYDFALFASGKTDIHMRFVSNLWDYIPGMFISEKAGGKWNKSMMEEHQFLIMANSDTVLSEASIIVSDVLDQFRIKSIPTEEEKMAITQKIMRHICLHTNDNNRTHICQSYGFKLTDASNLQKTCEYLESYLELADIEDIKEYAKNMGISTEILSNSHNVFIIHSSEDRLFSEAITSAFYHIGIPNKEMYCSSVDRLNTELGNSFHKIIKGQLRSSNLVIVLMSKNLCKSSYCMQELGAAMFLDTKIIPVIVDKMNPEDMPGFFDNTRYEATKIDSTEAVNIFIDSVCKARGIKASVSDIQNAVNIIISKLTASEGT